MSNGMIGPSPPRLVIPRASASPPAQSPNAQTGRPTMWTASALRKMVRLYLYTDLTLPQIVKIVHHCQASGQVPGKDSANKKLNAMFDQQPRWLRPSSSNMADRLEALSSSPTRTTLTPFQFAARPHSASDPSPYRSPIDFLSESGATPSPYGLSPASALTPDLSGREFSGAGFSYSPASGSSSYEEPMQFDDFRAELENHHHDDDQAFMEFVRKTTFMSCSTDHTTGSFQDLLSDRSPPYVQAVRRLVKRFTLPVNGILNGSPNSQTQNEPSSWVNDKDCPSPFQSHSSPLPGDFVSVSMYTAVGECNASSPVHMRRACYCAARASLPPSPWVVLGGMTPRAQHLHSQGPQQDDLAISDSCGNTILHYIARNDSSTLLLDLIASGAVDGILKARNTAGQTFLHLINTSSLSNINRDQLFQMLFSKLFDLSVKDHYGRTIFHMLLSRGVPEQVVQSLLQKYGRLECNTRDAFGLIPNPSLAAYSLGVHDGQPQTNSEALFWNTGMLFEHGQLHETQIIQDVGRAHDAPHREDIYGANGLHSLARATLSLRSVVDRNNLLRMPSERGRRGNRSPDQEVDSSTRKMQLRYELAETLLMAGVDPNHYDIHGNTPLMAFAAELPEDDDHKTGPIILDLLINKGANIHARNRAGETALHVAVRCGRKLAVRTLVNHGANVHARDADGRSLLEVADVKVKGTSSTDAKAYAHFEACRAWLSGKGAVQEPTVLQEWGSL